MNYLYCSFTICSWRRDYRCYAIKTEFLCQLFSGGFWTKFSKEDNYLLHLLKTLMDRRKQTMPRCSWIRLPGRLSGCFLVDWSANCARQRYFTIFVELKHAEKFALDWRSSRFGHFYSQWASIEGFSNQPIANLRLNGRNETIYWTRISVVLLHIISLFFKDDRSK